MIDISENNKLMLDYFFYEWLIVAKNLTKEQFIKLSNEEFKSLKEEFYNKYM